MKYLITLLCLAAAVVLAQPEALPVMSATATNTAVTVTNDTGVINGYLCGFNIALTPSIATGTVAIATVTGGKTLYSKSTTGAAAFVFPRAAVCDNAGSALTAYALFPIYNDRLKLTVTSATDSNVTATVTPVIDRQP